MDLSDAICSIAQSEARRIHPIHADPDSELYSELDEMDAPIGRHLPAFRIHPSSSRKLIATPLVNRDPGHDNAPRLLHLCSFLNTSILPMIDPECRLNGTFRVELHDSYSYLSNHTEYDNVFSFARPLDAKERSVALLPDPYHMNSFNGLTKAASLDPIRWSEKIPKLFFCGTTTGNRNPLTNQRIKACVWASTRPDLAVMSITHVAQMSMDSIINTWSLPTTKAIMGAYQPLETHFKYRYLVNIVGNTACWSRLPMILSSSSLMVHVRHADSMWYYPLIREGRHYVAADSEGGADLDRAFRFCSSYDQMCQRMVKEANHLSRELFTDSASAVTYLSELLEECAWMNAA